MFNFKVIFIVSCLILVVLAAEDGSVQQLKGAERKQALQVLRSTLRKLAAANGPTYTVNKVNSVTGQVVSGMVYNYKVGLTKNNNTKQCNVKIYSQSWLDKGNEITIKCPGERVVRKTV